MGFHSEKVGNSVTCIIGYLLREANTYFSAIKYKARQHITNYLHEYQCIQPNFICESVVFKKINFEIPPIAEVTLFYPLYLHLLKPQYLSHQINLF